MSASMVFRALFPFCGVGGGALGFRDAEVAFRSLGFGALGGVQ